MSKAFQYRPMAQRVTARSDGPPNIVTPSHDEAPVKAERVTKSRDADTSARPGVTVSRDEWEMVLARLAALEAWVAEKTKPGQTQAERAKRYRARKKALGRNDGGSNDSGAAQEV